MNQSQVKYIRERANRIKRDKEAAVREKYKAVELSDKDARAALRNGEFSVIRGGGGYGLRAYVRFDNETPRDDAAINRGIKAIGKSYDDLMDKTMLGDVEGALEALRAFEATE